MPFDINTAFVVGGVAYCEDCHYFRDPLSVVVPVSLGVGSRCADCGIALGSGVFALAAEEQVELLPYSGGVCDADGALRNTVYLCGHCTRIVCGGHTVRCVVCAVVVCTSQTCGPSCRCDPTVRRCYNHHLRHVRDCSESHLRPLVPQSSSVRRSAGAGRPAAFAFLCDSTEATLVTQKHVRPTRTTPARVARPRPGAQAEEANE